MVQAGRPQLTIKYCAENIRFSLWISKASWQSYTRNIKYLLLHNWQIRSDLVKSFTTTLTKKWETVQRRISHFDLFSQIVYVEKAMIWRIFFCFNAASGTLHTRKDLRTFYCCRRRKFAVPALCATLGICMYLTVTCNSTTTAHTECIVVFSQYQWLLERPKMLR
jgi:hypothetical protein